MIRRQIPLDQVAPWLVSGASGLYIVARARRLSLARPSRDPLWHFLVDQSDVILMLFGSPMVWYLTSRTRRGWLGRRTGYPGRRMGISPFHDLRQVFSALLIGTALLARKASQGKITELIALTMRLYSIIREGVHMLTDLDDRLAEELPEGILTSSAGLAQNGPRASSSW